MRVERAVLVLLGAAALCWLLVNAGCNSATLTSNTSDNGGGIPPQSNTAPRADWGMSLLSAGKTGSEMFPAKFTFDINAAPDCTNDYVVFNTSLAGSVTQATIVAFNQLYSTQGSVGGLCNQNGPSTMWAYNTGTDPVQTSVVLSLDGTKVAFVGTVGGGATLHILKWKAGEGAAVNTPATPTTTLSAGQSWAANCPAANSCIGNIAFSGNPQDTNSAPFVNYSNDTLYAGADDGTLHKFTGVFNGTPAEVTTGGWPITVHSATVLSSPVFDHPSGNIFVGDASGQLSYVREVGSTAGACASGSPPCLGSTTVSLGGTIVDAPIVDSSTGKVFWFDGKTTATTGQVVQTDTALGTTRTVTFANNNNTPLVSNFHSGAFDNAYLTSSSPSITGFLYVIARITGDRDRPALFRIGFSGTGLMNTSPDGGTGASLTLASNDGEDGSPVTEIINGTTDRIFFSVGNNADIQKDAGCSGTSSFGCIMSLTLGGTWPPSIATHGVPTPMVATTGSTSGIIVDNVSGSSQASSIYFSYGANAVTGATCNGSTGIGCAVKLTQSALQ